MKFNCVNTKHGCTATLPENDLKDHESECFFRLVPCPHPARGACLEKVIFRDVIQHYETVHEKMEKENVSETISLSLNDIGVSGKGCYTGPQKFCVKNRVFLLSGKTQSLIRYRWLQLLGSPNEAKHFSYTLKYFGENVTNTFEGKVASIDDTCRGVLDAGKYFAYPQSDFVSQFMDKNGELKVSLKIRNLKEEAKDENYESGISEDDDEK